MKEPRSPEQRGGGREGGLELCSEDIQRMSEKGAGVGLEQGRRGAGLWALHSGRPAFTCSGFREPAGL